MSFLQEIIDESPFERLRDAMFVGSGDSSHFNNFVHIFNPTVDVLTLVKKCKAEHDEWVSFQAALGGNTYQFKDMEYF